MPDSLHRTNINLYADDVAYLSKRYGHGWTERVREIIRRRVKKLKFRDENADLIDPLAKVDYND